MTSWPMSIRRCRPSSRHASTTSRDRHARLARHGLARLLARLLGCGSEVPRFPTESVVLGMLMDRPARSRDLGEQALLIVKVSSLKGGMGCVSVVFGSDRPPGG